MKLVKTFLAIVMLVIMTTSIVIAIPGNTQPLKVVSPQLGKSIALPVINIMNKVGPATFKYDEPLFLTANVTQLGQEICGLNESNFKLDTPLLTIKRVYPLKGPTQKYASSTCFYDIDILPGINQGKQYTWSPAKNYTFKFKLSYVLNGKELASRTLTMNETTVRELVVSAKNLSQPNSVVVVKR